MCIVWNPWASRLHTPLFALSAPIIVIALTNYAKVASKYVAVTAIVFMVLFSLPFALNNESRSLLSQEWWKRNDRIELYFKKKPYLYESYKRAMHVLEKAGPQNVGLYIGAEDWEYPFWVFAKESSHQLDIRFHHVGVNDRSKILQTDAYLPEYVIATKNIDAWQESKEYSLVYGDDNVRVLKRLGHKGVQATR
jgi:hypothetical protein